MLPSGVGGLAGGADGFAADASASPSEEELPATRPHTGGLAEKAPFWVTFMFAPAP